MVGFVNIIKPSGVSSAKVVAIVKKKLKTPCGHMGTLDPMASGVLPVGVGKTSRLFDYLLDKEKIYQADFVFGFSTDTLDTTGKVVERTGVIPTEDEIKSKLSAFVGEIDQIPPKYSAKCIDGTKCYSLARKGIEFDLPPKRVSVLGFELIGKKSENVYSFRIRCKGGTYIRSLARDLGLAVGSLAVMSALDRIKSGVFDYSNAITLEDFEKSENPEKFLLPSDIAVSFKKLVLSEVAATRLLNGIKENFGASDGIYNVYFEDVFLGVGVCENGVLKIKAYVREN